MHDINELLVLLAGEAATDRLEKSMPANPIYALLSDFEWHTKGEVLAAGNGDAPGHMVAISAAGWRIGRRVVHGRSEYRLLSHTGSYDA